MQNTQSLHSRQKLIVKKCHLCGHVHVSPIETQRCESCQKSFLPLNYFGKVHAKNSHEFESLFVAGDQLHEDDLIKGLYALW